MFSNYRKHALLNQADFRIHGLEVGVVNAIRRTILSDIPNVAPSFDAYNPKYNDIKFIENTSSLHNEMLSHRLSLVPIHFAPHEIDAFEPSAYTFKIEKHNTGTEPIIITSADISIYDASGNLLSEQEHKRLFPMDPVTNSPVIITKLKQNLFNRELGEKINVEYRARKGTGVENACWCPVSLCSYKFVVDEVKAARALEEKLAQIQDADKRADTKKIFETLEYLRHYKTNEYGDPAEYDFVIESECAMDPVYLFAKACDILSERVRSAKYEMAVINSDTNFYSLTFHHQDHTLGNLLQCLMYNTYVRGAAKDDQLLTYVGYNIPHPLEHDMLLKIRFSRQVDVDEFMRKALEEIATHIDDIKDNWLAFVAPKGSATETVSETLTPTPTPPAVKKRAAAKKAPAAKPKKGDIVEIIEPPKQEENAAPAPPKKRSAPKKKADAAAQQESPVDPPTAPKKAPARKSKKQEAAM